MAGARVFRIDGILHVVLGVLLLLSGWNELYEAFDLPRPLPALLTQVAGATVLAFGYLLWRVADEAAAMPVLVRAAVLNNALAAFVLLGWLIVRWDALTSDWNVEAFGKTLLIILFLARATLALLESRVARRQGRAAAEVAAA